MSHWTGPCLFEFHFLQKNGGAGCHRGQDLVGFELLWSFISYKRMEEQVVIADRTLLALNCLEFISYKRMEEQDVTVDRPLCYGFLQKNGGQGVMLDRTFG